MCRKRWIMLLVLGCAATALAQEAPPSPDVTAQTERPFAGLEDKFTERQQDLMREFQLWYDKSRDAGEKGKDWIVNDIKNIGDWEYRIVTLTATDEQELALQLNAFGKERWEVYWVQKKMQGTQFFLKRPVRTYMKHIPVGDLLNIVPKNEP
ncbi:MAG: hypothetical protein K8I00_03365 [Candidatus Omnitrophica bacterium]|nr:hypothetical protein [Candidatus Omnitrophota bacterium]